MNANAKQRRFAARCATVRRMVVLPLLATAALGASPETVQQVTFEVQRRGGSAKYPNDVLERYTLTADGKLQYSAYFGGMPTNMNHNDGVTWEWKEEAAKVFEAVQRILADPALLAGLPESDRADASVSLASYRVTLERQRHHSYGRVARDPQAKGYVALDAEFKGLIAAFEKATGRPMTPNQLPQR